MVELSVIDTLIYSTTSYALHAMAHEVACASLVVLGTVVEADESSSMTMSAFRPENQVRDGNGYVDEYEGDITQSSLLASLGVNNCSTNGDFASAGREISVGVGEAGTQREAPGTLLLPNRPHEGLMCHPQSMLVGGVIGHDLAARSAIDIVAPLRSREVELTSHLGPSPVAPGRFDLMPGIAPPYTHANPFANTPRVPAHVVDNLRATGSFGFGIGNGYGGDDYITIRRAEYNDLVFSKQRTDQLLQIIDSFEQKCSMRDNELRLLKV